MLIWKWASIAAIIIGQLSIASWAWRAGAGWRAVFIGIGFAVLNAVIFTDK